MVNANVNAAYYFSNYTNHLRFRTWMISTMKEENRFEGKVGKKNKFILQKEELAHIIECWQDGK